MGGKTTNIVDYPSLKYLHICFAGLSGGFFLVRGAWMLAGSPLLQMRWARTVPHVIDTALLTTAVALALWSSQYPLAQTWLTAKVLALIVYIVLGTIALKHGPTRRIRGLAYLAALLVLLYIAGVAISKNPLFFLGGYVTVADACEGSMCELTAFKSGNVFTNALRERPRHSCRGWIAQMPKASLLLRLEMNTTAV